MRIEKHPILGDLEAQEFVTIYYNGTPIKAVAGETVAAALTAYGITAFRKTSRFHESRGVFCAIGRCTDCVMTVNNVPNVRTCVTIVEEGMRIESQDGLGKWERTRISHE